jgi:arylsulfatase A-like enzyme
VIVLTSDHGDYLGDHWMGEKDLFHDCSVKVPLIVFDPSPDCDATRGTTCDALVEAIDLPATFVEMVGGEVPRHIVEGRSLMPFLRGERPADWREVAVSEYNYAHTGVRKALGVSAKDARLFMLADHRWKFVHVEGGFRPMLFDRATDPQELTDLGDDPDHAGVVREMYDRLARWARRDSQRVTQSDAQLDARMNGGGAMPVGILIGVWDEREIPEEYAAPYRHPVPGA